MSDDTLPSDVTSDIDAAMEQSEPATIAEPRRGWLGSVTHEQAGFAVATIIAFFGVAVIGPKLFELRRPRANLGYKAQRAAREARQRAEMAGLKAQKRLRRLGGGGIRR